MCRSTPSCRSAAPAGVGVLQSCDVRPIRGTEAHLSASFVLFLLAARSRLGATVGDRRAPSWTTGGGLAASDEQSCMCHAGEDFTDNLSISSLLTTLFILNL